MRILPINNQYINEEWISDKARFAYDGLKRWRFINPLIKENNHYIQVSWLNAFKFITKKIQNFNYNNIIINTGDFTDLETISVLKKFSKKLPNVIINNNITKNIDKQNYFLDTKNLINISGKKIFLLVGCNLKIENPVLNIRLKKLSESDSILIGYIGSKNNYNINSYHLGNNINILKNILEGKHKFNVTIQTFLKNNKIKNIFKNKISIIFGEEFNSKNVQFNFLENYLKINKFDYITLNKSVGKLNALELGFHNKNEKYNNSSGNINYLLGVEDYKKIRFTDFTIFQGHHNDKIRTSFDVILPSTNWTEKSSMYLNCFGILQKTNFVKYPPINSRSDWKIIRMLSIIFQNDIKFKNITEIHNYLNQLSPNIIKSLTKYKNDTKYKIQFSFYKNQNKKIIVENTPFRFSIFNYYNSNSIERASKIMNNCSNTIKKKYNNF